MPSSGEKKKTSLFKESGHSDGIWARNTAYTVTTIIKLGGLVLAGNEALFVNPPRDSIVFAIAAFMMAGATGLDGLVDRFLGGSGSKPGGSK